MAKGAKDTIPLIEFKKRKNSELEFEIAPFKRLFSWEKMGKLELPLGKIHRVQFNQIIVIEEGSGSHWVDFKEYKYKSGDAILVSKNQVQAFSAENPPEAWQILFTDSFYVEQFIPWLFNDVLIHLADTFAQVKNLTAALSTEFSIKSSNNPEILRHLLSALILTISRKTTYASASGIHPVLIVRFFEKIHSGLRTYRTAEHYAQQLGCSYKHLNQTCKKHLKTSAKSLIDHAVILEIKRQLATTDHSLQQIADEFHFEDDSNFLKYFKQRAKQTPRDFRISSQK